MNTTRRNIGIAVTIVAIALITFKLFYNKMTIDEKVYRYDAGKSIIVSIETVGYDTIEKTTVYTGMFEADRETKLSAETQGKVNEMHVEAGNWVKKNQILIQLDNALLKLQLQSLEVQIEGLQSDVNRYTVLANADAVQRVQLEKIQLGLRTAIIQRNTVLEQIKKTTITAPFAGVVTATLTEVGAFAAPGIPLMQISDLSILKFTIQVPETEIGMFTMDQYYDLSVDVFPGKTLRGRVTLIGSKGNNANNYPIQFSVGNTDGLDIKSGMFGKIKIREGGMEKHISIPTTSIVGSMVQPQVYLVKNGKASLHSIAVSRRVNDKVIVSDGLNEGDIIVRGGLFNLFDGANVIYN
jgi:RND family efflux transporter MFP subunit